LSDQRLFSYCFYYAHALARIDRQAAGVAIPALVEVLKGKPNAVPFPEAAATALRRQAAKTLGEIGAPAREALPSLRKALLDQDETIRSEAAGALKKVGG
jgi:HEAT repeat protein